MSTPRFGICDRCAHQRIVRSGRGSAFSLCRRSAGDPAYPKYPPMPVLRCAGWEQRCDEPPSPPPQR